MKLIYALLILSLSSLAFFKTDARPWPKVCVPLPSTAISCTSESPCKLIAFDEKDNLKHASIKLGQEIVIRLKSNRSTGYSWKLNNFDRSVLKQSEESRYTAPQKHRVGADGIESFYFKGKKKGTADLELFYTRPWEQGVPPAKKFRLIVHFV